MHDLTTIIYRNAAAVGREAAHAQVDGDYERRQSLLMRALKDNGVDRNASLGLADGFDRGRQEG